MKRAETRIRFDSKAQKEKFARVAKSRRFSLNTFLLVAAEAYCECLSGMSTHKLHEVFEKTGSIEEVKEAGI